MAADDQARRAIPDGMAFAEWRAADGWAHRRFDWPAPGQPRGSMLFQGGRGDFVEKYIEALSHWHRGGWRLSGFDWRGQGGSGRLLADAAIGHARSLDPLLDDLDGFVGQWLREMPAPHVIVGHSMGGHLILRLLAERQAEVDAAVLVAPMLGFASAPVPPAVVALLAGSACRLGLGARPAWREGDRPDLIQSRRQTNLTSCADRYQDELFWRRTRPEIAVGAPTWGWLAAALASMRRALRPGGLEAVRTPLLVLGSEHDRLINAAAIRRAAARLPDVRLRMFDPGAHELLREADPIRLAALSEIDAFLDVRAPPR